ncbi:hypothetical protein C5U62_31370 [Pseudomonas protegens]|uniref:Uncharacterized protein n=1 Tax=Pseudomonas protegens TaxID=380021 RepID=A0A2T6GBE4_9PSED|nr:hypothetical protein [Pseudomonas protegens]PUA41473.1 hypothetical protein C5U62_31370 [Pseudomonas protegens]
MKSEEADEVWVRTALIRAGYSDWPLNDRGDLYDALEQVLKADPEGHADFVEPLRSRLSAGDQRAWRAELEQVRKLHGFIKACPECGHKPDLGYQSVAGEVLVVCMNHPDGAVTEGGQSLAEAIARWNRDDVDPLGSERVCFPL